MPMNGTNVRYPAPNGFDIVEKNHSGTLTNNHIAVRIGAELRRQD